MKILKKLKKNFHFNTLIWSEPCLNTKILKKCFLGKSNIFSHAIREKNNYFQCYRNLITNNNSWKLEHVQGAINEMHNTK